MKIEQNDWELISLDGQLTKWELTYLRWLNERIDRQEFKETFDIDSILEKCKNKKSLKEMSAALWSDKESIALLQAYLFDNPHHIDWVLWDKTFKKINEHIEDQKEMEELNYSLSKSDFVRYFKWDDFQQWEVWSCWLISAIDSFSHIDKYEELIRSSVKKIEWWFIINMPLWAPRRRSESYTISSEDLLNQKSIYWSDLNLIHGKEWIKALMIAYGKVSTWKESFDVMALNWGYVWNAFNTMIYRINTYMNHKWRREEDESLTERFNNNLNELMSDIWLFKEEIELTEEERNKRVISELRSILENFDPRKELLSVSVNQWDWYEELWNWEWSNHDVSIEEAFKKNWELYLRVSNPHDSGKSYDISYEKFSKYFFAYSFSSFEQKQWLPPFKSTDYNNRKYQISEGRTKTLNRLIQQTWDFIKDQSESRWDVIVRNEGNKMYVESWWKTDSIVSVRWKDPNKQIIINIWWEKVSIRKDLFSNRFNETEDDNIIYAIYVARLTVLINKMRHDYIDKKMWDPNNQNPFSINKDWSLVFDDDPSKWDWTTYLKRTAAEFVWYDTIVSLKDWSKLWIKSSDISTKKKIADLLNRLYRKQR